MTAPLFIDSIEAAVDHVLDTIPGDIVLGIPLAVGKPNPFVNALYRRVKANPARKLRIITALSLLKPVGKSELEQHFLDPLVERVFGDYPDLEYAKDLRARALPPNIEVREFFMKTGDYIGNDVAQQGYISTNYTFVARDMAVQGMNVIAQAVGAKGEGDALRLSLSSNPDVIFEVVEKMREAGQPLLKIGVINQKMPFMPNGAEVGPDFYDVVITDPAGTHTVFGPPNNRVSAADYAIGLHASSLVTDGGTLQIGIGGTTGSLSPSSAMPCGTISLRACAPRLPPMTSRCSAPSRPAKRSAGGTIFAISGRTGLPAQTPFFSTSGKPVAIRSATPASTRLASPATEFCSCTTSGLPSSAAIMPPGKVM